MLNSPTTTRSMVRCSAFCRGCMRADQPTWPPWCASANATSPRYALHYALRLILMDDEFNMVRELAIVNEYFPVPERNRRFPLFRSPKAPDPVTGEISSLVPLGRAGVIRWRGR